MAVKLCLFIVILTSCVWLVLSMPVTPVLQSKSEITILKNEYYEDVFLPRFKKAAVVVGTCPQGMKWYNNRCLTPKQYERQQDEDYGDDSTVDTPNDSAEDLSTNEDSLNSVTVVTGSTSTGTVHNQNTVSHKTDLSSEDETILLEGKDKPTKEHSSSTEKIYNDKTKAGTTKSGANDKEKNTLKRRKFYELAFTVLSVCSIVGILIIFPKCLCQRDLKRHEVESGTSLLPSSTEANRTD